MQEFSAYIGRKSERHVLILMGNFSAYGEVETHSHIEKVDVCFLPPNCTSNIQPLDSGIIASMKIRYRSLKLEHVLDLASMDSRDIYKVGILTDMKWMNTVWNDTTANCIRNCWCVTGMMGS